jgi:peptidoglycan/LPS O-acetylase OafA/YrhL
VNPQLSRYLDLMRVVCAVVVVFSHLGHGHLIGGLLWPFTYIGNEAVMAFFVLSGFVIAFVSHEREHQLADYAAARLARLYSVILPALLLTLVLDAAGHAIHAGSYASARVDNKGGLLAGYGLSLLMLNQSWDLNQHFGSDGAYWSIPYEFWYYFIFGAATLLRGWQRWAYALLGAALAGPKILMLMPVWLLGVGLYHGLRRRPPPVLSVLAVLGSAVLLLAMLWKDCRTAGTGSLLGLQADSLPWQYLFALGVALHIYGMGWCARGLAGVFTFIQRPLTALAGSTLALYLFHLPVVSFINAIATAHGRSVFTSAALLITPFAVALTFGRWCERQKSPLRRWLLKRMGAAARQPPA